MVLWLSFSISNSPPPHNWVNAVDASEARCVEKNVGFRGLIRVSFGGNAALFGGDFSVESQHWVARYLIISTEQRIL